MVSFYLVTVGGAVAQADSLSNMSLITSQRPSPKETGNGYVHMRVVYALNDDTKLFGQYFFARCDSLYG